MEKVLINYMETLLERLQEFPKKYKKKAVI